jgi:hypothetical protein
VSFKIYFNEGRQWIEVRFVDPSHEYLQEAHAFYWTAAKRKPRSGLFGYIYIRNDWDGYALDELITHEVGHMVMDWFWSHKNGVINRGNEEQFVVMLSEIRRAFIEAMTA